MSSCLSSLKSDPVTYCAYYHAQITAGKIHLLVAILKSFDHLCFDRTIDAQNNIFEFFVPVGLEDEFVTLMGHLKQQGLIVQLQSLPNRLKPIA